MEVPAETPLLDERFLLFETLGRGGMGSVYRAFDRIERRVVAVKVARGEAAEPFAAEFEAWSRLRHPNVVRAYELGTARRGPLPRGTPYLVLESFRGKPAHLALGAGRTGPAPLEELVRGLLRALDHVHEAGLVHRDLKPGNVLVAATRRGSVRVKLTDFGLAAEAGHAAELGRVSGSLPYVSPEAILGMPLDGRADLYGLGILLYLLACGRRPIESRDPRDLLRWHLAGARPDAAIDLAHLPPRLARFIVRLMARCRDERPASAREALACLGGRLAPRFRPLSARIDRADLAALRLAIDAARDGARRVLELHADQDAAAALVEQARTFAQLRGLAFCRVGGRARADGSLGAALLRLLLERSTNARAVVEKFGLQLDLPIELLGELPLWDETRRASDSEASGAARARAAARLAAFLVSASMRQALVWVFEGDACEDPLARALLLRLERCLASSAAPGAGLLVLRIRSGRNTLATAREDRACGAVAAHPVHASPGGGGAGAKEEALVRGRVRIHARKGPEQDLR